MLNATFAVNDVADRFPQLSVFFSCAATEQRVHIPIPLHILLFMSRLDFTRSDFDDAWDSISDPDFQTIIVISLVTDDPLQEVESYACNVLQLSPVDTNIFAGVLPFESPIINLARISALDHDHHATVSIRSSSTVALHHLVERIEPFRKC